MPRDLADVLHYFMPELVSEEDPPHGSTTAQCPPAPSPAVHEPAVDLGLREPPVLFRHQDGRFGLCGGSRRGFLLGSRNLK